MHMASETLSFLSEQFDDSQITKIETVQSLWSGYGELARYYLPKKNKTIIVKHIKPPNLVRHPRGWNTDISHQRKLRSYEVEVQFYREFAAQSDEFCRVPEFLASYTKSNSTWLVLEDLDQSGFTLRFSDTSIEWIRHVLRWLAYFHANHLATTAEDLSPIGTYWHLSTRPDEFAKMPESALKASAALIDSKLNNSQYQTLVHGDAKLANFCFHENLNDLAAVDFQYVGKGVGVKDIAYFFGSCFYDEDLFKHADTMLDEYFLTLEKACKHYEVNLPFQLLEKQWRELYPLAWADFNRFLQGWSPGHYKLNGYMQEQTKIALSSLANLA